MNNYYFKLYTNERCKSSGMKFIHKYIFPLFVLFSSTVIFFKIKFFQFSLFHSFVVNLKLFLFILLINDHPLKNIKKKFSLLPRQFITDQNTQEFNDN